MRREELVVYARIEYITRDVDGNIVIGISKKTAVEDIFKLLKEYENAEVHIFIVRVYPNAESTSTEESYSSYLDGLDELV